MADSPVKPPPGRAAAPAPDARIAGVRIYGPSRLVLFRGLPHEVITVGRSSRRDIRIRDDTVSRLHCIIGRSDAPGGYHIFDCQARNGVYVAEPGDPGIEARIDRHPLAVGMPIQLGDVTLIPVDERGEPSTRDFRLCPCARPCPCAHARETRAAARRAPAKENRDE